MLVESRMGEVGVEPHASELVEVVEKDNESLGVPLEHWVLRSIDADGHSMIAKLRCTFVGQDDGNVSLQCDLGQQ